MDDARAPAVVAGIFVYPLKGAGGIRPPAWRLEASGLRLDRRWMLVDADGSCVTQHENTRLALIHSSVRSGELVFTAPGLDAVRVPTGSDAGARTRVRTEMSEDIWALSVDSALDAWFSTALGMACRLVRAAEEPQRWLEPGAKRHALHFQKSVPLHLVGQASLDDLNGRLRTPVPMDRFRPNLVVSGTGPHEDDGWRTIQIGDAILRVVRACDHRCGVPNIDQATGERSVEPLRTLATYRRSDRGIFFGQNVAVERVGELRVGEPVIVLERGGD